MIGRSFTSSTLGLFMVGLTLWPALAGATSLGIVNGDFETHTLIGWTKDPNSSSNKYGATDDSFATTPDSHTWYAGARAYGSTGVYSSSINQLIDFNYYATGIYSRLLSVSLHGYGFGETGQDKGILHLAFLDINNLIFKSALESVYRVTSEEWTELSIGPKDIPYGTTFLKIEPLAMKYPDEGTKTGVGIDNNSGEYHVETSHQTPWNFSIVPKPGAILLLGTGLVGLAIWRRKKQSQ